MAPNMAPGKKPTAMAAAGYSGQDDERSEDVVVLADFSADEDGDGTGVMVAWGVTVGVAFVALVVVEMVVEELDTEAVAVVAVFLSKAHVLFPEHVYPNGQQSSPHLARLSLSRVDLMTLSGCIVTFCSCISHVIGVM